MNLGIGIKNLNKMDLLAISAKINIVCAYINAIINYTLSNSIGCKYLLYAELLNKLAVTGITKVLA